MLRLLYLLIGIGIGCSAAGQRVYNYEVPVSGSITLTEQIAIPRINPGYTLWLPESGTIRGMVVFLQPRRDTLTTEPLIDVALAQRLAVLYATTDNRFEFFFSDTALAEVAGYIREAIDRYAIPSGGLLYCGMSLAGTRALKLAAYGQRAGVEAPLRPRAIAICDAPLDMVRFHREMVKAAERQVTEITTNEGTWVSGYLASNLGGTPADAPAAYVAYSPYCYRVDGGPNLPFFRDVAIRAYTEPDVQWWMKTRGKDYYAMNAIDLAAFVNELRLRGNSEAELITTRDRGYHPDGSRHPHSWSIVDERELVEWFVGLLE